MALYITEYGGFLSGRPMAPGYPQEPPVQTQIMSSGGGTSTFFLSTATRLVRLIAEGGAWILFTGSTGSTTVATSTNCSKINGNVAPEYRYVVPGSRFTVLST